MGQLNVAEINPVTAVANGIKAVAHDCNVFVCAACKSECMFAGAGNLVFRRSKPMKTKALQTAPTLFVAESKMKTAVLAKSSRPGKKIRSSHWKQNHPCWRDGLRGFYDAQRPCAQSFLSSAPSQRKLGRPRDSWILGSLDSVEQKDNRRVHKRSASSGHRRTFLVYGIKLAEPNSWFCLHQFARSNVCFSMFHLR